MRCPKPFAVFALLGGRVVLLLFCALAGSDRLWPSLCLNVQMGRRAVPHNHHRAQHFHNHKSPLPRAACFLADITAH